MRKPPRTAAAELAKQEALKVPGLAARLAAAAILRDVLVGGHTLDELFSAPLGLSRLAGVAQRDIAFTRSIVTVALRRLGTIRNALNELLENGFPRNVPQLELYLTVAAAQILFLDVPDHAAVDLAVRMTRLDPKSAPYAALVNGVCRNLSAAAMRCLPQQPHSMATRPPGSPRVGARPMATSSRKRSPRPTASSQHWMSASRPTPRSGRKNSMRSCCRPALCGSGLI